MAKILIGDIFECTCQEGKLYLQFVGIHPLLGECVLCNDRPIKETPDFENWSASPIFYPLKLNVKQKNVAFTKNSPTNRSVPTAVRRPLIIQNGQVKSWAIDLPTSTTVVTHLTVDQAQLPVGSVMSHEVLVSWKKGEWRYLFG